MNFNVLHNENILFFSQVRKPHPPSDLNHIGFFLSSSKLNFKGVIVKKEEHKKFIWIVKHLFLKSLFSISLCQCNLRNLLWEVFWSITTEKFLYKLWHIFLMKVTPTLSEAWMDETGRLNLYLETYSGGVEHVYTISVLYLFYHGVVVFHHYIWLKDKIIKKFHWLFKVNT